MVLSIFTELFNYHHNQLYFFKIYYLNLFKFYYYLFFTAPSLCCCTWAFSSCSEWELLFVEVHRFLFLQGTGSRQVRFTSCSSKAQLLRGMWNPPRLGIEPVSCALAGRFSSTMPLGKSSTILEYYHHPTKKAQILKQSLVISP